MSKGGFIPLGGGSSGGNTFSGMLSGGGSWQLNKMLVIAVVVVYAYTTVMLYQSYTAATAQLAVLDTKNKVPLQTQPWKQYVVVK